MEVSKSPYKCIRYFTLLRHCLGIGGTIPRGLFESPSTIIQHVFSREANTCRTTSELVSYLSARNLELKSDNSHSQLNKLRVDLALCSQKVRNAFGLLIPILYLAYTETVDKRQKKGSALPKPSQTKGE